MQRKVSVLSSTMGVVTALNRERRVSSTALEALEENRESIIFAYFHTDAAINVARFQVFLIRALISV